MQHIFQCGYSKTAKGTEGILDAYRAVFETDLIMSGPSEISHVLRQAAARSKMFYKAPIATTKSMQYCVLLILTDGMVNDLASTKELVQSYKRLNIPLSVIGLEGLISLNFTNGVSSPQMNVDAFNLWSLGSINSNQTLCQSVVKSSAGSSCATSIIFVTDGL